MPEPESLTAILTRGVVPATVEPTDAIDALLRQDVLAAMQEGRAPRPESEVLAEVDPAALAAWRQRNDRLAEARQVRLAEERQEANRARIRARIESARVPARFRGLGWEDLDRSRHAHAIRDCQAAADPRAKLAPPGLLLLGAPGNGKTTLAALALTSWIEATVGLWPARFWPVALELQAQREQMRDQDRDRISELVESRFVVIDDLDKVVRSGERRSPWVDEVLYAVIDSLYARQARVIITSNWTPEQAQDRLDYALFSRITDMCRVVQLAPHDYRVEGVQ